MDQTERGSRKSVNRRKRRLQKRLLKLGILVCAVAFMIGAYITLRALFEDRDAKASYAVIRTQMHSIAYKNSVSSGALTAPTDGTSGADAASTAPDIDFTALKSINRDIVAWLAAEGTVIDYPVLHGEDNEYYLTHLYNNERNRAGSLFVDHRNTGLFTERNTVIYGHNMKSGAMFNTLSDYKQQDYYDANPTMTLCTPDGTYCIELFSGTVEDGSRDFVRFDFESDTAFMEYVDSFRTRSTFSSDVEIKPGDRIVSLLTCSYEVDNARYLLMGRLISLN